MIPSAKNTNRVSERMVSSSNFFCFPLAEVTAVKYTVHIRVKKVQGFGIV
jgi:hypothetical protein